MYKNCKSFSYFFFDMSRNIEVEKNLFALFKLFAARNGPIIRQRFLKIYIQNFYQRNKTWHNPYSNCWWFLSILFLDNFLTGSRDKLIVRDIINWAGFERKLSHLSVCYFVSATWFLHFCFAIFFFVCLRRFSLTADCSCDILVF